VLAGREGWKKEHARLGFKEPRSPGERWIEK
jgi:hypothetical protein